MKKKLLFYMILGLLTVSTNLFADEKDYWSYYAKTDWYDNNKENTVFTINNAKELAGLAQLVNDAAEPQSFAGKTIRLGDHIDLSDFLWVPIGRKDFPFEGSFDGNNKNISGLKIEDNPIYPNYLGLFGRVDVPDLNGCSFKDVTIKGGKEAGITRQGNEFYIAAALIALVNTGPTGDKYTLSLSNCHNEIPITITDNNHVNQIGGLVGQLNGNISCINCTNSGDIASEADNQNYVGGLIGWSWQGTISFYTCANSGSITGKGGSGIVGGIIGNCQNFLSIDNCLNSGNLTDGGRIGGLAGASYEDVTITSSYSAAKITCAQNGNGGGLIGVASGDNISISDCFAAGSILGDQGISGGIVGEISSSKADRSLSLSNNLVMLSALQGKTVNRIVGKSSIAVADNNNYAYPLPSITKSPSGIDGKDWLGYMDEKPIAAWNPKIWSIDETRIHLPQLIALGRQNVDVENLYCRTITWVANGGSPALSTTTELVNNPIRQRVHPQRAGYCVEGWYIKVGDETIRWDFGTPIQDNMTLYAAWIEAPGLFFDTRGGSLIPAQYVDYGTTATKPADPSRTGYIFLGWTASPEGNTPDWDFNTPINEDITIYAVWQPQLWADFITVDPVATQIYTGKALTPAVTVRHGKEILQPDVDYVVSYKDNIEIGTGSATITGKGSYGGTVTIYFPIQAPTQVVSLTIEEVENATTIPAAGTSWYQAGLKPVITIIPGEGFSLQYIFVYLNEQQIYPDPLRSVEVTEEEGQLTLKLDQLMENARLRIEGISPVSIDATADDFSLSLQPNGIRIDAARASTLQIVRLNGAMEMLRALPTGSTFIGLAPGTYLVRIEGNSWKVIVK